MGSSQSAEANHEVKPTGGSGPEAFLNVYEPQDPNQRTVVGYGIYHTGIEIGSTEYAYGGGSVSASGVYSQQPRSAPPGSQWIYKTSLSLGRIKAKGYSSILEDLKKKFPADQYDTINFNCNHFTYEFAKKLGVDINYPAWVNKAAKMGSTFGMGKKAPPQEPEAKSVFETTKGHSLVDSKSSTGTGSKPTTTNDPEHKRRNPWADPNFRPTNVVDDSAAVAKK